MRKGAIVLAAFGIVMVTTLYTEAHAGECLILNNERVWLKQSEVYQNGCLKFRIDDWDSPEGVPGTVDIRSNLPAFNEKLVTDVSGTRHFFIRKDTVFGSRIEVTANCENTYFRRWKCLFSEF
jgi:hypothetical protein